VDDGVSAFLLAARYADALRGRAFNVGGGPENAVSLLEMVQTIRKCTGYRQKLLWQPERPGDQRYYVSDFGSFRRATGWEPQIGYHEGVRDLVAWCREQQIVRPGDRELMVA
jgi:CDP-paratose 2-epimerase